MIKWDDDSGWRKEYENYINYLENNDYSNNNHCHESEEYYEKLETVKLIIESISVVKEGFDSAPDEDDVNVRWVVNNMELKLDEIIPESDTFCISVHINTVRSKNANYRKENIIYFYEIQDEYISRNIIFSSNCLSIFNDGNEVLSELFSVLKIFLTQEKGPFK